ncbi:MAG: cytochrome C [Geobacteraceae bacterium]|nr:cytochrome C [Geobacteraceae bacterium]NTW81048.1 cytochrome C [Geobacteraceae bacterium]
MRKTNIRLLLLAAVGIVGIVTSCSQMKTIPDLPGSHPKVLAVGQQVDCSECHKGEQNVTLKDRNSFSHTPVFVKNHRFYAASDDRLCSACHQGSFCNDCHTNKIEMKPSTVYGHRPEREFQHRGNFMTLHKIEGKLDPASCYRCHGRANNERCIACHR